MWTDRRLLAAGALVAGALVAGSRRAAAGGSAIVPLRPLPAPTGRHAVGTAVTAVRGPRELPVQVWYPARAPSGGRPPRPARLFPNRGVGRALAAVYPVPAVLARALRLIRGWAVEGLPPAVDPPAGLVVLVHGWLGSRVMHVDLAEQLASDGWVVAAADHVGGALVAQHPDGRVWPLEPELMPDRGDRDTDPRSAALVARYAADVRAVLDAAAAGELPHVPAAAASRVLVVGQSTGGGAAALAAVRDDRVAGVVGLDPWVVPVPEEDRAALDVPVVAIQSGGWTGGPNARALRAMPTVEVRDLPEAGHSDLTVLGYLGPLVRRTGLVTCDPALPHDAALLALADVARAAGFSGGRRSARSRG